MLRPPSRPPDAMEEPRVSEPGDGPEGAGSLSLMHPPSTVDELQSIVNAFASDAIRGRPCKLINSKGACLDTEYRLDNSLQHLLVFTPGADRSCFEPAVIRSVGNEQDLENLMMTTYMDATGVATC